MSRVLVAGAGAIGQWLGARLQDAGHDVTLLLRPRFQEVLETEGLTVHGHTTFQGRVPSITHLADAGDPAQGEPTGPAHGGPGRGPGFDAIFLTAKAYATADLAEVCAPSLAPGGVLASLQNGLGNGEKLRRVVDEADAAVCLTSHGLNVEAPGRIHHAGTGPTKVGPVPGSTRDAGARKAHRLLADAGLDPQWCPSMRGPVWQKAIVNAAINPVGALYGVRNGEILARDDLRGLSDGLAREAAALAAAARVELPPTDAVETVHTVLEATADNRCSMLQDVQAERATELEQITGRLVRLAERLLVAMPRSESIYGRLKDLERGYLGDEASERLAWEELEHIGDPF